MFFLWFDFLWLTGILSVLYTSIYYCWMLNNLVLGELFLYFLIGLLSSTCWQIHGNIQAALKIFMLKRNP
jgi:hypothetical protein